MFKPVTIVGVAGKTGMAWLIFTTNGVQQNLVSIRAGINRGNLGAIGGFGPGSGQNSGALTL